jgi:hypothetical protein
MQQVAGGRLALAFEHGTRPAPYACRQVAALQQQAGHSAAARQRLDPSHPTRRPPAAPTGRSPAPSPAHLTAPVQLLGHVLGDLVQRHVARALVHDLHVARPRAPRQLALRLQLGKLRRVVGVCARRGRRGHGSRVSRARGALAGKRAGPGQGGRAAGRPGGWRRPPGACTCNAARPEAVADGEADVVGGADVQDVVPVLVAAGGWVMMAVAMAMGGGWPTAAVSCLLPKGSAAGPGRWALGAGRWALGLQGVCATGGGEGRQAAKGRQQGRRARAPPRTQSSRGAPAGRAWRGWSRRATRCPSRGWRSAGCGAAARRRGW